MPAVLLPISSEEDYKTLTPFCIKLANLLNHTLIITTFKDHQLSISKRIKTKDERVIGSEKKFYEAIESCVSSNDLDISMVFIWPETIGLLPNKNCLQFFSKFRNLKVPYLLLPASIKTDWELHTIFFPIAGREGEKEASAWAGFWTRYSCSGLYLIHPEISNNSIRKEILPILSFTKRLLDKSGVNYHLLKMNCKTNKTIPDSIKLAKEDNQSMLILPAHRLNSPEYIFTGPPEKKILKNRGNTPVLFVNPRHDLFLPCG